MKLKFSVTIDKELSSWIEQEIKEGRFASVSHAVSYALNELKKKDEEMEGPVFFVGVAKTVLTENGYRYQTDTEIGRGISSHVLQADIIINNKILLFQSGRISPFRAAERIGSSVSAMLESGYEKLYLVLTEPVNRSMDRYYLTGDYKKYIKILGEKYVNLVDVLSFEEMLEMVRKHAL